MSAVRKSKKAVSVILIICIVLCTAVFAFSAVKIIKKLCQYSGSDDFYEKTASEYIKVESAGSESESPGVSVPFSVDWNKLRNMNPDIIGWIYQEGTPLNYPVVHCDSNEKYNHRLIDGSYNDGGTLFADCRHVADFSKFNFVIYGHHMLNGSMFGNIANYKSQSYYDSHPVLWYATPDAVYRVELLAGVIIRVDDDLFLQYDTAEEFDHILQKAYANSTFKSKAGKTDIKNVLMLATCSYEYEGARYVLFGNPVKVG